LFCLEYRSDEFTKINPIMDDLEEIILKDEPIIKKQKVVKEEVKEPAKPKPEKKAPKVEPIYKIPEPVPSSKLQTKVEKIEKFKMPSEDSQEKGFMDNLDSSFNDASEDDRYTFITITHIVKSIVVEEGCKS
jgi:hypothetical protein